MFDFKRWDTNGISDLVVAPTKLIAKTRGQYLVFGAVQWNGGAPGSIRNLGIRQNGNDQFFPALHTIDATVFGQGNKASISAQVRLEPGEYVELVVFQNSGGPQDVVGGCNGAQFGMVKVP